MNVSTKAIVAGTVMLLLGVPGICESGPVMVDKNLFSPDRKPPTEESAQTTPQNKGPGLSAKAIQLDGVVIVGDTKKALLRIKDKAAVGGPGEKSKSQSPYVTVKEGGQVGDFQVVKIEPKSISLEKDGQTTILSIISEGKVSPPVPTAPVAAPQPDPNRSARPNVAPPQPAQQPVFPGAFGQAQPPGRPGGNTPNPAVQRQIPQPQQPDEMEAPDEDPADDGAELDQ